MRSWSGTGRKRARRRREIDTERHGCGLRSIAITFYRIARRNKLGRWSSILVDPLNDLAIDSGSHNISDCAFGMLVQTGVCCMDGRTVVVCMMLSFMQGILIRTLGHSRARDIHSKFLEPGGTADVDRQLWLPQSVSLPGAGGGLRYVPPRSKAPRTRCSCTSRSRTVRWRHSSWSLGCRSLCQGSWYS